MVVEEEEENVLNNDRGSTLTFVNLEQNKDNLIQTNVEFKDVFLYGDMELKKPEPDPKTIKADSPKKGKKSAKSPKSGGKGKGKKKVEEPIVLLPQNMSFLSQIKAEDQDDQNTVYDQNSSQLHINRFYGGNDKCFVHPNIQNES